MLKIAVLGPEGTFSAVGAERFLKAGKREGEKVYYRTIEDTVDGVLTCCDLGVIPVENTLDGYVQRTLDLLKEKDIQITGEFYIPVRFALMANAGSQDQLRRLFVQFKAQGQCRQFLNSLKDVGLILTENNMESYEKMAEGEEGTGAIVPVHMAPPSGGKGRILMKDVTDSKENMTRFLVVEKLRKPMVETDPAPANGPLKTSVCIMPDDDRPGMLFEILKEFSARQLNLISIMSRPGGKGMGRYNFFIDIEGDKGARAETVEALTAIGRRYSIKILGIYSQIF